MLNDNNSDDDLVLNILRFLIISFMTGVTVTAVYVLISALLA